MTNKNKWLAGIASLFAIGATIFFIRKSKNSGYEKPSKRAPQLNIENPGSQDDFPKPPIESHLG